MSGLVLLFSKDQDRKGIGSMSVTKVNHETAQKALEAQAKKVTDADVEKVLQKKEEIEAKFAAHGPLGRFIADVQILFSLVQDYIQGKYRVVPWWSIAAVVAALLYVVNPFDLVPDAIPLVGALDDALVVAVCLSAVQQDLHKYVEWKKNQPAEAQ